MPETSVASEDAEASSRVVRSAIKWWENDLSPEERRELLNEYLPNGTWEGDTAYRHHKLQKMYVEQEGVEEFSHHKCACEDLSHVLSGKGDYWICRSCKRSAVKVGEKFVEVRS